MPTIGVLNVSPLSFDQNNPFLTGLGKGQDIATNFQNQQLLRQQILDAQYKNQMAAAQAQYAQPTAYAELLQKQAQPGLTQAETSERNQLAQGYGIANQLAQAGLPYNLIKKISEAQQAQNTIYTDPTINRIAQAANASKAGLGDTLRAYGLLPNELPPQGTGLPANQPSPGSPESKLPTLPVNTQKVDAAFTNAQNNPSLAVPHPLSGIQNAPGINALTAPRVSGSNDTAKNWALYGSPLAPGQASGLEEQAKKDVDEYQKEMNESNENANKANAMTRDLDSFKNAYAKAKYKGPVGGMAPSSGLLTALLPGNLTPEQTLDSLSSKMIAGLRSEAVGGRVTNDQVNNWLSKMKPGRAMEEGAVNNISNILGSSADREKERPAFIDKAVKSGIPIQTAKALYNKYDNERPPYDPISMTPIKENIGSWPSYISQEAIDALHNQKPFMPNVPKGGLVTVVTPNGRTLRLPLEGAERLIKEHPDHKRIE
jgi:hypothetical protein